MGHWPAADTGINCLDSASRTLLAETYAHQLARRSRDDSRALDAKRVPRKARPLVIALNELFVRVSGMFELERQFTADAAHELRSPLTALRIQSEVALLAEENGNTPRLDGHNSLMTDLSHIDWRRLASEVVEELSPLAEQKRWRGA